ncbi:helix-turn-helix domain-containing protein [Sphingomonas sp. 22R3R2A-7]|uniref:helix-turn-helix domain-containing protein n=1 Tax=Sphingomonas sp. 22R3R2A-7 TaxID=3050230 RepID=UPI002FE14173
MERVGVGEVEVKHSAARPQASSMPAPDRRVDIAVDRYRQIVFPNRLREMRHRHARLALLQFAALIPQISYIRLSKIERGEVYPRADELARIAGALGIAPRGLLIDIDAPTFDMDAWFAPFAEGAASDDEHEARFALLLAAAIRARRSADPTLTAATLDARYGIPPSSCRGSRMR